MVVLVFADCESYCKPVKGNLKINMKKYCKKDYGKIVDLTARIMFCFGSIDLSVLFLECVLSGPSERAGHGDGGGLGKVLSQRGVCVQEPWGAVEAR